MQTKVDNRFAVPRSARGVQIGERFEAEDSERRVSASDRRSIVTNDKASSFGGQSTASLKPASDRRSRVTLADWITTGKHSKQKRKGGFLSLSKSANPAGSNSIKHHDVSKCRRAHEKIKSINVPQDRPQPHFCCCPGTTAHTVAFTSVSVEKVMMVQQIETAQNVSAQKLTSPASPNFNMATVKSALASAVAVVKASNRVLLDLAEDESDASYIENKETGGNVLVRIGGSNTFVFDVQYDSGERGVNNP